MFTTTYTDFRTVNLLSNRESLSQRIPSYRGCVYNNIL